MAEGFNVNDRVVVNPDTEFPVPGVVMAIGSDGRLLIVMDRSHKRIIKGPDEVRLADAPEGG